METFKRFTPTKKVFLYFYSKTSDNKYQYIFIRNFLSKDKYGIISSESTLIDNHPLFTSARVLTNSFYKLLLGDNLSKIINGEITDISSLFLPNDKPLPHLKLWADPVMNYWLDKLSEQIIQYDDIDNIKIFFIELPLLDIKKLNSILQKNNYKYSFEYFTNETLLKELLDSESLNILSLLDLNKITEHIKSTEEFLKTNKGDLYIILACKKYGKNEKGFFHFPSLFKGIYRRNREDWRYLLVSKNEYPDEETLKKTRCLIIPGSELSVHDDLDFLRKTEKYMADLTKEIEENGKYPNLKILGICFGLEIIMSGLGAELDKNEWSAKARFGPEIINLKDEFWKLEYVIKSGIPKRKSLVIAEAHSEQIIKYPPQEKNYFTTIGSSDACECEISIDKKGQILMLQGHPEYSPGLSISRSVDMIMEFSGYKKEDINEESMKKFSEEYMNKEENKSSNFNEWRAICDSFMRYKNLVHK